MKTLIDNIKEQGIYSVIGLILLAATCISIVLLVAFYSNGVISTDFVVR